jgi:hypothetical protein
MLIYLPSCAKVVCESLHDSKPMTFGGTWTGLRMILAGRAKTQSN